MNNSGIILVTGATGQQGGAVARELLANGFKVRAMTRHPEGEKARMLATWGATIIKGDLDDAESLEKALNDVWGVFAVQNTWEAGVEKEEEQGKRIVQLARKGGVHHFVYTSVSSADRRTGIPHFENKFRIEEEVRRQKFPSYTILRPVFFMENWITPWFKPPIDQGNIAVALRPQTRLQMVAVKDIGKYGLWAFQNHEPLNGRAIDFAGDELSMTDIAREISNAKGKPVGFITVPIEEVRKFSQDFALMFEWFENIGYNADISAVAKKSGIRPTRFSEWAASVKW
ncbi:NmrA family protein [Candidatus Zixiibacteriota bacterium]|nr:NmrA family protein [candidate division Zixibacteria bacterium]